MPTGACPYCHVVPDDDPSAGYEVTGTSWVSPPELLEEIRKIAREEIKLALQELGAKKGD